MSKQKKDAQPDRKIVQEALDDFLEKSKKHGGITFAHIWAILWHRNPAHTTWKVGACLLTAALLIGGAGWKAHGIKLQLFPETGHPSEPSRALMPNVLDAETSFISHQAADWLYPLVQRLEGNSRTALQVTVQFKQATQGARVQLIAPGVEPLTGFAFFVRKDGEREHYEPLARLKDEKLQFIVDVPPPDRGDRLVFLTSAAGRVTSDQLRGLFMVRRANK